MILLAFSNMKHKPSAIEESHMLNSELLTSLQLYYASKVKRRKKQPFILLKKDSKWHCMNTRTCMTELYSAWRLAAISAGYANIQTR